MSISGKLQNSEMFLCCWNEQQCLKIIMIWTAIQLKLKSFLFEGSSSRHALQCTILPQNEGLLEEFLWHCSPDWCRPSFYLRCMSGVWSSILRHVPCSCVLSLYSVERREKDSSMCAPKHLLLWVLAPHTLPLGPRLNPREAKKIPLVFGGS